MDKRTGSVVYISSTYVLYMAESDLDYMYSIQNGKYHKFELSFQLFRVQQFIELTSCMHAAMFMGNVNDFWYMGFSC